jgi:hypothetical protein
VAADYGDQITRGEQRANNIARSELERAARDQGRDERRCWREGRAVARLGRARCVERSIQMRRRSLRWVGNGNWEWGMS